MVDKMPDIEKLVARRRRELGTEKVEFFNAGDQTFGEGERDPHPLDLVTVCVVTTLGERTFVGRHTAPSVDAYDRAKGEAAAKEAAELEIRKAIEITIDFERPRGPVAE